LYAVLSAQDLRLAHHHRIQAGRHAKQVVDGVATLAPVDVRLDGWRTDGLLLGQKASTMACGSALSSVVRTISTRLQVEESRLR